MNPLLLEPLSEAQAVPPRVNIMAMQSRLTTLGHPSSLHQSARNTERAPNASCNGEHDIVAPHPYWRCHACHCPPF
jgi:hypothetical protein